MEDTVTKVVKQLYASVDRKHCKSYSFLKDGIRAFFTRDLGEPIISGSDLVVFFRTAHWDSYLSSLPERIQTLFIVQDKEQVWNYNIHCELLLTNFVYK
jgi:hypothetical protein